MAKKDSTPKESKEQKEPLIDLSQLDIQKAAMVKAMVKSLGIVSKAARKIGIVRQTHYNWMASDEAYKAAIQSINEEVMDFAEDALFTLVRKGDTAATIFLTKCKLRSRGYGETGEVHHVHSGVVGVSPVDLSTLSDEDLDTLINLKEKLSAK